jgi:Ca2+-binding EF-hand superfamily protein
MFYGIFNEFDTNGDGVLSRKEMRRFVSRFLDLPSLQYDEIINLVNTVWFEFDTDRSGKLNRKETLRFLNAFLTNQG